MADRELNINLLTKFNERGIKRFRDSLKDLDKKAIRGVIKGLKGIGLAAGAAFAGGTVAAVRFGQESISLAKEQIRVEAQLEQAYESTGGAVGLTVQELKDLASELQGVTNFGDEATLAAQAMLLTFTNVGAETFPRATAAILDVSTAMGQDLKTSTIQLGKALNDPVAGLGALRRVGIQFTEDQEALIESLVETGDIAGAQAIILNELERQFGGSAAAAREADGGIIAFNNALGDVQEEIGKELLPLFTGHIETATEALAAIAPVVIEFASNLADTAEPAMILIGDAAQRIGIAFGLVDENASGMDVTLKVLEKGLGVVVTGLQALALIAQGLALAAEAAGPQVRGFADDIMELRDALSGGDLFEKLRALERFTPQGLTRRFVGRGLSIPGFQEGGIVPGPLGQPQLAVVHGGETITPPGETNQNTVNVNINNPVFGNAVSSDEVIAMLQQYTDEIIVPALS